MEIPCLNDVVVLYESSVKIHPIYRNRNLLMYYLDISWQEFDTMVREGRTTTIEFPDDTELVVLGYITNLCNRNEHWLCVQVKSSKDSQLVGKLIFVHFDEAASFDVQEIVVSAKEKPESKDDEDKGEDFSNI